MPSGWAHAWWGLEGQSGTHGSWGPTDGHLQSWEAAVGSTCWVGGSKGGSVCS